MRVNRRERSNRAIWSTSPNGIFAPVLNGTGNDFVAGTIPLIVTTPGIKLLGPLPGDLQNYLVYTAVVLAGHLAA